MKPADKRLNAAQKQKQKFRTRQNESRVQKQVGDLSIQEIMEKAIETTSPLGAVETGRIVIK